MQELRTMIEKYASVPADGVIKVDRFLNHLIEPQLILAIGKALAERFSGEAIDKVLTVEASGIAPALGAALALGVPVLFAKKSLPSTMVEGFRAEVHSFTKQKDTTIFVSSEYLRPGERILMVDDFLARGHSLMGMHSIIQQAGAVAVGAGIVIEKSFQRGRQPLEAQGLRVESLVRIMSISSQNGIEFLD